MEKYIPLDALVAWAKETYLCENASMIRKVCYKQLLEHLDNLKVKEVNLKTMFREYVTKTYTEEHSRQILDGSTTNIDSSDLYGAICHGFELGLNASNPLTLVDLEKEINKYISDNFFGSETMGFFAARTKEEPNDQDIALCAKYFFELGMQVSNKAQKGE